MRLKRLSVNKFIGVDSAEMELHPVLNGIFGQHYQGKSSLRDAFGFALTGLCRGTDMAGRGSTSLLKDDAQVGAASIVVEPTGIKPEGEWVICRTVSAGSPSRLTVMDPENTQYEGKVAEEFARQIRGCSKELALACIDPLRFLDQPAKEQSSVLVEAACPSFDSTEIYMLAGQTVQARAMKKLGLVLEPMLAVANGKRKVTQGDLGAVYKHFYDQRRSAKSLLIQEQGAEASLEKQRDRLDKEGLQPIQTTLVPPLRDAKALEQLMAEKSSEVVRLREVRDTASKAMVEAERKDVELTRLVTEIKAGKATCPSIWSPRDCPFSQASMKEAQQALPTKEADLKHVRKARADAKTALDRAMAEHRIADSGLDALRTEHTAAVAAEAARGATQQSAESERTRILEALSKVAKRVTELTEAVADFDILVNLFEGRNLPARLVQEKIAGAGAQIDRIIRAMGEDKLKIGVEYRDGEGFALYGQPRGRERRVPTALLSGYERIVAGLAIACWMAISTGFGIATVDEFSTIVRGRRTPVSAALLRAGDRLQSFLICACETSPGPNPSMGVWWVNGGMAYQVVQPEAEVAE